MAGHAPQARSVSSGSDGPLGPVDAARHAELVLHPRRERVACVDGVAHRRAGQGDERHHVDRARCGDGRRGASRGRWRRPRPARPRRGRSTHGAAQGEHGAVVVVVGVQVEQAVAGGVGEASRTSRRRPSLTLITHSSTGPTLAHDGRRSRPPAVRLRVGRRGATAPWDRPRRGALRAEQLGFTSVWLADHLFSSWIQVRRAPGRHRAVDPLVGLAAIARAAPTLRGRHARLCGQLRPPKVLAKALATLDIVSDGRLTAAMGAGWFEPGVRRRVPSPSSPLRSAWSNWPKPSRS